MSAFAIVQTGGKQLRVEPRQVIDVERVESKGDAKEVTLDKVLLVHQDETLKVGNPFVKGARVICEYLGEVRGPKVLSFKMRRRKNYRRKRGHRQLYAQLRIKEIVVGAN